MGKLREEYENLKDKEEWNKLDIIDRLQSSIDDPTRHCFRSSQAAALYEDLIPQGIKSVRDRDLLVLLEAKIFTLKKNDPDNKKNDDRRGFTLLTKITRRKLTIDDLSSKLALTSAELMALASITSANPKKKQLFLNKALQLLGIGGQRVSEMQELKHTEDEVFNMSGVVNERLKKELPERFENNELAKILIERVNNIFSKQMNDRERIAELDVLLDKITTTIDGEEEIEKEDFNVLVYFQRIILSQIEHLEGPRPKKI